LALQNRPIPGFPTAKCGFQRRFDARTVKVPSELNAIASMMPEGRLRNGLQEVAGQVVAKGFGGRQT
jgi:hypothetical protein